MVGKDRETCWANAALCLTFSISVSKLNWSTEEWEAARATCDKAGHMDQELEWETDNV